MLNEYNKSLPHGNIDFLVTGSAENTMVGLLVVDGVLVVDGEEASLMVAGSTKTEISMGKKKSGGFL